MLTGSRVSYYVETAASSGSISTQYFGQQFDATQVETGPLTYTVRVYLPASVIYIRNATLHLDVKKESMKDLLIGEDKLLVEETRVETSHQTFNYSPPTGGDYPYYNIVLKREVILADLRKQQLIQMPGFQVTWHYSGMEVESLAYYYNSHKLKTMAFIRNSSNINYHHFSYIESYCYPYYNSYEIF